MTYYNENNPSIEDTVLITSRDLAGETQPSLPLRPPGRGCSAPSARVLIFIFVALGAYFLAPIRNNLLILGIDRTPEGSDIGRSDTMILLSAQPLTGHVNMLSIPRDLWVPIPGYGENRINAAHSFGEGAQTGSGPRLALQTVKQNFGVNVNHYIRIRLVGFAGVIDAMGGADITLTESAAGYPPGRHHLDGTQALAFVRDRTGDDFFRMQHGQIFVVSMVKKMVDPLSWLRIPGAMIALSQTVDANLPAWMWPRVGFAILRAAIFEDINSRTIPRDATTSWVTDAGAQVLLPNWELIRPLVREMFGIF
jgi:LCP family protein required for cell wall assembly